MTILKSQSLHRLSSILAGLAIAIAVIPRGATAQGELRVEERVGRLESRVINLETQSTAFLSAIRDLSRVTVKHEERIQALEQRLQALDQRVQALSKQIAENNKPDVDDKNPKTLTVRAPFVVVDGQGKEMMRVGQGEAGPTLTMVGTNSATARLTTHDLIIRTTATDAGGVRVGVGLRGNGHLFLIRKGGEVAADIGFDQATERLGLRFYNNKQITAEIGVADAAPGAGFLQLGNGHGNTTAEIGANTKNEMSLKVRSNTGQVVAGLGVSPDGDGGGAIKLANGKGAILASMIAAPEAGHVNVFGVDGKARANMGAEPDGRGFLRIGSDKNVEAASLTVTPMGSGFLQTKDPQGVGAVLGTTSKDGSAFGDLCLRSSKQKELCFSMLAVKNLIKYW
jgi:uncharacterized coiled-coil protein SlyX